MVLHAKRIKQVYNLKTQKSEQNKKSFLRNDKELYKASNEYTMPTAHMS